MQITTKVDGDLEKKILRALLPEINIYLKKSLAGIKPQLKFLIQGSIENSPEYQSLLGGQLQAELGVPDPEPALKDAVDGLLAGIKVNVRTAQIAGNSIIAGFEIGVLSSSLQEVFSASSSYLTEKGQTIPWLDWLLTLGDTIILRDYEVKLGFSKNSRTGLGTMVNGLRGWRVPSQFSGTVDDNFLTRALENLDVHIQDIISKEMRL